METNNTFSFVTWNVNYSRRAEGEYEHYNWDHRKDAAFAFLNQQAPDVLFLQEIRNDRTEEFSKRLSDYVWTFEPTLSRNGFCSNAIGLKKAWLNGRSITKLTKDFSTLHSNAEKVLGVVVDRLCLLNVRFPMDKNGRETMAKHLSDSYHEHRVEQVLIAGDMNTFPDWYGPEQLEDMEKNTRTARVTDGAICASDGKVATISFKAYPYDVVKPWPEGTIPMKLDHIAVKGLAVAPQTVPIVFDNIGMEGKSFLASDHYPIFAQFQRA